MRLRPLPALTAREFALLAITVPLVIAVRAALWLLPSQVIVRLVGVISDDTGADAPRRHFEYSTIVWAVESVSRRVPRATCLTRAIAGKLLLRWFGLAARLCIGVTCEREGALRAHAWLERDGRTVLGGEAVGAMVRMPELPTSRRRQPTRSR